MLKQKLLDTCCIENEFLYKYIELIDNNVTSLPIKDKTQRHHAIPVFIYKIQNNCKNRRRAETIADKDKDNFCVNLNYREHILAHYYLALCCREEYKFQFYFIFFRMTKIRKIEDFNPEKDLKKYDEIYANYCIENFKYRKIHPAWNKGGTSWSKGKHLSDEHKRKIGESNKGKKKSPETIEKLKLTRKGHQPWNAGKKLSKEHIEKLSKSHKGQIPWIKGKHHSVKAKMKESVPVVQYDLSGKFIAEYYGTVEAEAHTGVDNSNIVRCCRGKRKTAGGFKWEYKEH